MFYVWEGSHPVIAWLRHIQRHYSNDKRWHYLVNCIFLDSKGSVWVLLDAMNFVNSLVRTTIPHNFI